MRVLQIHNRYRMLGGEDRVVESEARLLREAGVELRQLFFDSDSIGGLVDKVRVAWRLPWSEASRSKVLSVCREFRPEVVHVHNFFPLATPSIFSAAKEAGARTVLTLHNFRLFCSNGLLFRDGKPCELCLYALDPAPAIDHACYQRSRVATYPVARMIRFNRDRETWGRDVDQFIALSDFSRERFLRWGIPAERLAVKPNFLYEPATAAPPLPGRGRFLFVGRFSEEKGLRSLLAAKALVPEAQLDLVGDGPLESLVRDAVAAAGGSVRWHGRLDQAGVYEKIRESDAIVFPSECYENFPVTILEAMAHRRPVIASRLGAPAEILANGRAGRLFEVGSNGLALAMRGLMADAGECARLGVEGRKIYEALYAPAPNMERLLALYRGKDSKDLRQE